MRFVAVLEPLGTALGVSARISARSKQKQMPVGLTPFVSINPFSEQWQTIRCHTHTHTPTHTSTHRRTLAPTHTCTEQDSSFTFIDADILLPFNLAPLHTIQAFVWASRKQRIWWAVLESKYNSYTALCLLKRSALRFFANKTRNLKYATKSNIQAQQAHERRSSQYKTHYQNAP